MECLHCLEECHATTLLHVTHPCPQKLTHTLARNGSSCAATSTMLHTSVPQSVQCRYQGLRPARFAAADSTTGNKVYAVVAPTSATQRPRQCVLAFLLLPRQTMQLLQLFLCPCTGFLVNQLAMTIRQRFRCSQVCCLKGPTESALFRAAHALHSPSPLHRVRYYRCTGTPPPLLSNNVGRQHQPLQRLVRPGLLNIRR